MKALPVVGLAAMSLLASCSQRDETADAPVNIDAAAREATIGMLNSDSSARNTVEVGDRAIAADGTIAAASDQLPASATARYRCVDGSRYVVRFDNRRDVATLIEDGRTLATMAGQRPASGIWYRGGGWELRGKGREATLTKPDGPALPCIS